MKTAIPVAWITAALLVTALLVPPKPVNGASVEEVEAGVNAALERFRAQVKGADEYLEGAKGVLVIPNVIQAGFVIGGEYGEGALRVEGKTVDYYRLVSGSFGFQLGAQKKDIVLIFFQDEALKQFRASKGWEAGVDGSIAVVEGVEGSVDTTTIRKPIVGFVVGQKGLMYNLSLEGTKFSKVEK